MAPAALDHERLPEAADATARALDAEIARTLRGARRYPDQTAFIPLDLPDVARIVAAYWRAGQTVVVVHPTGAELPLYPEPTLDPTPVTFWRRALARAFARRDHTTR